MKALKMFTLPLLTIAIGSATAYAQQQPSEDAVNPQNRNPVSSQQGDQAHDASHSASSQDDSFVSLSGAGMAFEQLARTRSEEMEDVSVVADSGKELGEIEKIVMKSSDSALYALIEREDDSMAAVKLSELEIYEISYDGSADDLENKAYDESEFESIRMASQPASGNAGGGERQLGQEGAANSNSQTAGRSSNATPTVSDANSPLIRALALTNPAHLEGKKLSGDDDEDLGQIEQIVSRKSDNDYYAVVSNSQNGNKAVVQLEELELEKLSFIGNESDLETRVEESDYRDVSEL